MGILEGNKVLNLVTDEIGYPNGRLLDNASPWFDILGLLNTHVLNPDDRDENDKREIVLNQIEWPQIHQYQNQKLFYCLASPQVKFVELFDLNSNHFEFIIEKIRRNKNIYFLFTCEHEFIDENEVNKISDILKKYSLPPDKFIFLNNNFKSSILKKKYNIDIQKINFIDYSSVNSFTESSIKDVKVDKEGLLFMLRNRAYRNYRISLIHLLDKQRLLDKVNYSLLQIPDKSNISGFTFLYSHEYVERNRKYFENYNKVSLDTYEKNIDFYNFETNHWKKTKKGFTKQFVLETAESFENHYCNIISESVFDSTTYPNTIHITEKSFRPFYFMQLPIFVATPFHVNTLREHYGFDMYDDLIDHSYDLEENDVKRLHLIVDEIKRLSDNENDVINFYKNNVERIKNNHKRLIHVNMNKKHDFELFYNLI